MYLDPGFGSMIFQVIIAGIATVGAWFFVGRKKISNMISKKMKKETAEDINQNDSSQQL